jgi:UBX domain-containing protein 1
MAGFASMADMRAKEEEEKKAKGKGKGTESYAGGEKSGLAIENPDDAWKQMEQQAQNQQASGSGPTSGAHQITLWRNGFTIGDGPLRPLSDPLNKKFVDDIAAGIVPEELKNGDEDIPVSMHDKRGEDYSLPSAAGSSTAPRKTAAPAKIENAVSGGEGTVAVDASKPTTKIQIRFQDGSRKAQEFNQDHTVGDLRNFCKQVTGQPMTVKGGYPPKQLTDDSMTLKDAGLCGAAVTVQPE